LLAWIKRPKAKPAKKKTAGAKPTARRKAKKAAKPAAARKTPAPKPATVAA
jgi:hypothetical protein